jgi:hypothetical protein
VAYVPPKCRTKEGFHKQVASTHDINKLISKLAKQYDGLIPTSSLRSAGIDRQSITRRVDSGLLLPVHRGVRILAGTELTPLRRAMAAAMVTPNSWISHSSALGFYQATLKCEHLYSDISSTQQVRIRLIRSHHQATYPSDLGKRFDLHVSRPWAAIIECAAVLSADELAVAMDSVVQAKHASFKRIQRTMDMAGPFAGRLMLAELLNDRLNGEGLVRSFLERDLEKLLKRAKLPPAVRNFAVRLPSGKKRVLDVAWPNVRRCLEADSWQYHSSPSLWGGTRIKDRELTVAGWSVIPVVVADTRDPSSLVAQLRTMFSNETAA